MNLHDLNPATLQPSVALDALIAEKWRGWIRHEHPPLPLLGTERHWTYPDGTRVERWHTQSNYGEDAAWPFSTDAAAAGEARRKATGFLVGHSQGNRSIVWAEAEYAPGKWTEQYRVEWSNTNNDKAAAEALATCRAIVAALQAAEAERGGDD